MTEQQLAAAHVGSRFEQMDGERGAHRVRGDGFRDVGGSVRLLARLLNGKAGDGSAWDVAGEEPPLGLLQAPPLPQDFQQPGGEHDIAVFLSLALVNPDDHALTIDLRGLQAHGLGDPQPGGVTSGEDRAMLGAGHATEKVPDLFRAENDGQFLGFLGCRDDVCQGPMLVPVIL